MSVAPVDRDPGGNAVWQGCNLRDAAIRTGTPALLASEAVLRTNVRELLAGLKSAWPLVTLRYCAKTNPELQLLKTIASEGIEVLAAHVADVELALDAGFPARSIAYQRPVLTTDEVRKAVDLGVRRFHAFRESDLDLLDDAAIESGATLQVSLRIVLPRSGMAILKSASARLGMLPEAATATRKRRNLEIDALNVYIGTQQQSEQAYHRPVERLFGLAAALRAGGHPVREINLGGGVPSPTLSRLTATGLLRRFAGVAGERGEVSLRTYGMRLAAMFAQRASAAGMRDVSLALEPGRAIVGNAVVLLTRVAVAERGWLFLDCGRNVLVESPLAFSRWIEPVARANGRRRSWNISGPTLNTLDVVDLKRRLPEMSPGDLVAVGDAGAYTIARATQYAGLSPAMWMWTADGELRMIRRAVTTADLSAPMRVT